MYAIRSYYGAYLEISKEYVYIDPAKVIEYANLAMPIIQENQDREQEAFANLLRITSYNVCYTKLLR